MKDTEVTDLGMMPTSCPLPFSELLALRRWNTLMIFNGLEQYTRTDIKAVANVDEAVDFLPQAGPMVGYAVTLVVEPSSPKHAQGNPDGWRDWFRYVASVDGPKIVVCQDLDQPRVYGSFWGEVMGSVLRQLGCVGGIVDGGIRDLDELTYAGLKILARRLCVSHSHAAPVRWDTEVEAFGVKVRPGQLIHADKHGFLVVPEGEESGLLEAARFMDQNENDTLIAAARCTNGDAHTIVEAVCKASYVFSDYTLAKFGRRGEWDRG